MKYVLDASVAIAALRDTEPSHKEALRRCMPLFAGEDEIVVPAIFDLEVTSALLRQGASPTSVAQFLAAHLTARTQVTIGPRAIAAVKGIIQKTRLRAADALYVWVAVREGLSLITGDREVLDRAPLAGASVESP